MSRVHIGNFYIGFECVAFYALLNETGGSFRYCPLPKGKLPEIEIGLDYDDFNRVVSVLLHETVEFASGRVGARFTVDPRNTSNHCDYTFIFDHQKFTEIMGMVSWCLDESIKALRKAWDKGQKKKKKSK